MVIPDDDELITFKKLNDLLLTDPSPFRAIQEHRMLIEEWGVTGILWLTLNQPEPDTMATVSTSFC